jgi:hypothetical protein
MPGAASPETPPGSVFKQQGGTRVWIINSAFRHEAVFGLLPSQPWIFSKNQGAFGQPWRWLLNVVPGWMNRNSEFSNTLPEKTTG